jgi:hypothetical protein
MTEDTWIPLGDAVKDALEKIVADLNKEPAE